MSKNSETNTLNKLSENTQFERITDGLIRETDFWIAKCIQSNNENQQLIIALQEKENSIQSLYQTIEELKKENQKIREEMISTVDYKLLKEELSNVKHHNEQLIDMLVDSINAGNEVADVLIDKNKSDCKLKMQLSYLESQNKRYQNSIDRLKSKWYGKLGFKIYKFLFAH